MSTSHSMDYPWGKSQARMAPALSLFQANVTRGKLLLPRDMEIHFQTKQKIIKRVNQRPQKNNLIMFTNTRYKWLSVQFPASSLWLIGN